jgi:hypothetical protein
MSDDALELAYARGDFTANAMLADESVDPEARERARSWLARISVDAYVYATLGFALLLFCAIVLRYGFF